MHTLTDNIKITQCLAPASRDESTGSGVYTGTYIAAGDAEYVTFILSTGALSTSDTLDLAILEATDSSGTGAAALTGAALTQILAATGATKSFAVTVKSTQLSSGFTHLAPRLTVGGSSATMLTAINAVQYNLRTAPAATTGFTQDVLLVA